jgi:kynurenine 3-monooxygenase
VTLFLPNEGDPSFATVQSGEDAHRLFARDFPDAVPLIPALEEDFESNPTGTLATLYLDRWHLDGRAVLIGDAAHAMVPFHGQGMNCAFEDCVALARHLDAADDLAMAFAGFEGERMPNARAIQAMALENYLEMRERVDDADFLLQRELERLLAERHPDRFVPRYTMVTFRRLPYATAFERGQAQRALLVEATRGRTSLDGLDWTWLDAEVERRLPPLPVEE